MVCPRKTTTWPSTACRNEHCYGRWMAALPRSIPDLEIETKSPISYRIFPTRRLPQYHRNRYRYASKYRYRLRYSNPHIPTSCRHSSASCRHLCILAGSTTLLTFHENDVQRHHLRYHTPGRMGHDRHLDAKIRLPSRLGILALSDFLRALRVPLV